MIHDFTQLLWPWSALIYSGAAIGFAIAGFIVAGTVASFEDAKFERSSNAAQAELSAKKLEAQIEFNRANPDKAQSFYMGW